MIGSCNRIKLFFVCFINYVLWLYSFCTIYVLRASVLVRKLSFCNAITMKYLSSLNSCFKSLDITLSLLAQYFATLQCNPALALCSSNCATSGTFSCWLCHAELHRPTWKETVRLFSFWICMYMYACSTKDTCCSTFIIALQVCWNRCSRFENV